MYILISGGFENDDPATKERIGAFVSALGAAVSKHGHTLLNGCRTEFDRMIAEAAYKDMQERGVEDPDERVSLLRAGRPRAAARLRHDHQVAAGRLGRQGSGRGDRAA